jgi:phosphopantothenoylcysteine decarboxylase/phosphopantothenate--cysteine ligase
MTEANPLAGRRVVLGVTGSVAAYKAVEIASGLTRAGAEVPAVLTAAAQEFVRPLSFEAVTRQRVYTGLFEERSYEPRHIGLAESADLLLIAPATAQTMARLALGLADDLLSCTALATASPILVAPAMNHGMYSHPATQEHLQTLLDRGVHVVGPESGRLASGATGLGRMSEPEEVIQATRRILEEARNAVC